jgi:hypothetical protein
VGNEWIDFNNQYFKIPIAKDGIYRLNYTDLVAAGFPASADPTTIQLFHRGKEQAIIVNGESDNQFNPGDYIEFYGRGNDGTLDAQLYETPTSQPHTFYNLYSDTTSYFLTFGSNFGKRIQNIQLSSSGLTTEPFYYAEQMLILKDQYSTGTDYGEIQKSSFDDGEGWMGNQIIQSQSISYTVDGITLAVQSAGNPSVDILLIGRGPMAHAVELSAGSHVLGTANFSEFKSFKFSSTLNWTDVNSNGQVTITARVLGSPDRISVGYILVRFPQQTDLNGVGKIFFPRDNSTGNSLFQLKNAPAGTSVFDVTDVSNIKRIVTTQSATTNAVVDPAITKKILTTNIVLNSTIKKVAFRKINPASHNYIIISHPTLRKPTSGYTDPVKAYAEYRAQPQGGQFDTLVVNVDDLYDQFNYGEKSSLAIYHFMKFFAASKLPDYLFLIGKGLDPSMGYSRSPNSFPIYKDLVPPAGNPGSDMAYTIGLSGSTDAAVATGRLSASGPQDVVAYLNKIKESEARPFDDLRRKNFLHLSGGLYTGEPELFKGYLAQDANIAKSFSVGANVKAVAKQTTNLEVINVADEINKGLAMVTLFGHSSSSSSDFDIGYVTDPIMGYNNSGKYPMFLLNGCLAGSAFLNQTIFGENWTNTPNKGALGVIAHTNLAFAFNLANYSNLFYQVAFRDEVFVRKGVGDVQKEVARRFFEKFGVTPVTISQAEQMVLLGDPAFKIFGATKPDFEIRPESVSINSTTGETITALTDSLRVSFVVNNNGLAKDQLVKIHIKRTLKDGSQREYSVNRNSTLYSDTIRVVIPGNIENGFGNNAFEITVDADNAVDELREENNVFTLPFFIPLNRTRNLFPDNYAIVNKNEVILSFQHTDLLASEREFLLEVDTSRDFNSSFKKQFLLKTKVIGSQKLTLLDRDTTAYYWRTRLVNPLPVESPAWETSSFTFIKNGPTGWAQVQFNQYVDNEVIGLVKDPELKQLKFTESKTDIAIKTFGAGLNKPRDSTSFKIKGVEYNIYVDPTTGFLCRNNTINFIAFDKTTTAPYPGIYFTWQDLLYTYGGRRLLCGREPYVINSFTPAELVYDNKGDVIKYIDNIAEADSVIIFNIGDAGYADWPAAAKTKMSELGISLGQINAITDGEPIIIFAKKGSTPGSAKVIRTSGTPSDQQQLKINGSITGRASEGMMKSVAIGPAKQWKQFLVKNSNIESSDKISFDVIGVKTDGSHVVLKSAVTSTVDLSTISTADFPLLEVKFNAEDKLLLTPAKLNHWLVTFDPLPEGILLFDGSITKIDLNEGQVFKPQFRFVNISDTSFPDSLTVTQLLQNPETFKSSAGQTKIKSPLPRDTSRFTVPFKTNGFEGVLDATVTVNPKTTPEQTYDNNVVTLKNIIDVMADSNAPVLDVTVDGRHLQDEEYVSPSPKIKISLWDNNQYLLKTDTVGVNIFLANDCSDLNCNFKRINFSSVDVAWNGETDKSVFEVNFNPKSLSDGTYTLRVVASDAHGNKSGDVPYEIAFKILNETIVTLSPPFPNPSYDKATFEFILTGAMVPSSVHLSLTSVAGRNIQSFNLTSENFHIGTNDVVWRTVDDQGNPLPNGVYLYDFRVVIDGHTTRARGKLVVVR